MDSNSLLLNKQIPIRKNIWKLLQTFSRQSEQQSRFEVVCLKIHINQQIKRTGVECERKKKASILATQITTCFFMMALIFCLKRVICWSTTFFSAIYFLWHWVCDPWHAVKSQDNDMLTAQLGGSSSSRCTGMAPIKPAPITRTEKEYPLVCKKLTCVIQVLTVFSGNLI